MQLISNQPAPLIFYSARKVAELLRNYTSKKRAKFLLSLRWEIREKINIFPLNWLDWIILNDLFSTVCISWMKEHREDIVNDYQMECNYGYSVSPYWKFWKKRKIKCNRLHCNNEIEVTDRAYLYRNYNRINFHICGKCREGYKIIHIRSVLREIKSR